MASNKNRTAGPPSQSKAPTGAGKLPAPTPGTGTALPLEMVVVELKDVGAVRDHMEDWTQYFIPPDPKTRAHKGAIYLVADGMGGHQAGEVASQTAAELVVGEYYADTEHDVGTSLVRAFRLANEQLYSLSRASAARSGMGTTLVAAVILGRKVYIANVGDSRAYLINQKGIRQITEDHSWVAEQVRANLLTPEQARNHPQRNVVTRALGSKATVEVDLFEGEINDGDTLLLCSDGVTGHMEDREIAALVTGQPPEEAARQMIGQANERGGTDNMSIIIVTARRASAAAGAPAGTPHAAPRPARSRQRRSPLVPVLSMVAVALLAVGGALGFGVLRQGGGGRATAAVAQITATNTATPELPSASPLPPPAATLEPTPTGAEALATPAATGEMTALAPTSTLAPSGTPVAAPTQKPPASTPRASTPTATAERRYPPPALDRPEDGDSLSGNQAQTFDWTWDGPPLATDDYFDLRIWSEKEGTAASRGVIAPTKDQSATIDLTTVHTISERNSPNNVYYWGVVVVRQRPGKAPQIVGDWSQARTFIYVPPDSGEPEPTARGPEPPVGPKPPTKTPRP